MRGKGGGRREEGGGMRLPIFLVGKTAVWFMSRKSSDDRQTRRQTDRLFY